MAIADFVELSGLEKASVLLMTLGTDKSAQVLRHLDEDEIEKLSSQIVRMREADPRLKEAVVAEFEAMWLLHGDHAHDGKDFAEKVLREVLGGEKAGELLERAVRSSADRPFAFLWNADGDLIARVLTQEPAQVVALTLRNLPPGKAAEVLPLLGEDTQRDVALCICSAAEIEADVVVAIEQALEAKYASASRRKHMPHGPEALVRILNKAGRSTERTLLNALKTQDPSMGEQVRGMMFVFEDFAGLDDKAIRMILRHVDPLDVCIALKGADDQMKERFFSNMSDRARTAVLEDLEAMGPVRVKDIENMQQKMVGVARRLISQGRIVPVRAGEEQIA